MFQRNSLALRIAVLFTSITGLTIAVMGSAILWLFTLSSERMLDNHLMAYADVIISQVETKGNRLALRGGGELLAALPRYWQISSEGKGLFKSKNLENWLPTQPEDMQEQQRLALKAGEKDIVALQTTFLFPGKRKITLISGLDAEVAQAYKTQERESLAKPLYHVLLLGGLMLAGMCVLFAYYALRPVKEVKTSLQDIRAGKTKRLEGDYPAEISALTDEINYLLDYTSGSIAKHREFSSNLAHALKTPLTVIANETDVNVIKTKLRGLMDIVERSLARVHAAGTSSILSASTPVLPVLSEICEGFGRVYERRIDVDFPADAMFRGDRADLYEVLGNIIENACKFSRSTVSISGGNNVVVIEDDGPGIPEERRAEVLKRGARLDETTPGTGIGLAVANDIITLYNGDIRLETAASGGLKVLVFLSAAR